MKLLADALVQRRRATSKAGPLGWLIVLFVASRFLYLVLVHPDYLLTVPDDELYRGTIAQEIVTGLKMPFVEYRADDYSGGSLVVGPLAAIFFLFFGPTVFALKLVPLLFFILALVFWYLTIQRYVSERVAVYFALIFCFPPPLFTAYSLTAVGFHSESIFFSAVTAFLLFKIASDDDCPLYYPALLGLTAGFGLWFIYTYGPTLVAVLLFWFWYRKGRPDWVRLGCFAIFFVVGFWPWIIVNVHNGFAGLVIRGTKVWDYFGFEYPLGALSNPRGLFLYELFANIGSQDSRDLLRRATNLVYSGIFLGPILSVVGMSVRNSLRSQPTERKSNRLRLEFFGALYLCLFALIVELSHFKAASYNIAVYPFLFFFATYSIARLQDTFPLVQARIETVFLSSVIVFGIGAHAPLCSLDRAGYAFSAQGYSYGLLPVFYFSRASVASAGDEAVPQLVQKPFLSSILPKLSAEDQKEMSLSIVQILAGAAPLNGSPRELSRIQGLIPRGFDKHFDYWLGITAMYRHRNDLWAAVAAVDFLQHDSTGSHPLVLIGIYRAWPEVASLDVSPESVANSAAAVPPELQPHYWRAHGHIAGRYWYDKGGSLAHLDTQLQVLMPRLDPSVQRYFLQGVGQLLFSRLFTAPSFKPSEMERFPDAYQQGLLEGWGMTLGELDLFSALPWKGDESPYWRASTKGLSEKSLSYIRLGERQFQTLFEAPSLSISYTSVQGKTALHPGAAKRPAPAEETKRHQHDAEET